MAPRTVPRPARAKLTVLAVFLVLFGGCFAGYWTSSTASGGEVTVGEEHEVNFSVQDTFLIVEDVLRADGVLFDIKPDNSIITFWNDADTPVSVWASLIGMRARYRYEIQVASEGSHRSKIIANVRTEEIADNEIDQYKASRKLDLFNHFDQLAARLPPPSTTPRSGGVNFAVLPGEDLRALAKRATGNPDNWREIARDNGLQSPTDLAGVQSVWVSSALLSQANKQQTPAPATH